MLVKKTPERTAERDFRAWQDQEKAGEPGGGDSFVLGKGHYESRKRRKLGKREGKIVGKSKKRKHESTPERASCKKGKSRNHT